MGRWTFAVVSISSYREPKNHTTAKKFGSEPDHKTAKKVWWVSQILRKHKKKVLIGEPNHTKTKKSLVGEQHHTKTKTNFGR